MNRRDFFKFLGVAPLAVTAPLALREDSLDDIAGRFGVSRAPAAPRAVILHAPPHTSAAERAAAAEALLEVCDGVIVLPDEYRVEFIDGDPLDLGPGHFEYRLDGEIQTSSDGTTWTKRS